MIIDRLTNWRKYTDPASAMGLGFSYLENALHDDLSDGRVDIDGNRVFALIQGYTTRQTDNCRFEAHRRYADIQFVWKGGESMGWIPGKLLRMEEDCLARKDVAFFHRPDVYTTLHVLAGDFAVFFPGEGHMPGIRLAGHDEVRKVVIKFLPDGAVP